MASALWGPPGHSSASSQCIRRHRLISRLMCVRRWGNAKWTDAAEAFSGSHTCDGLLLSGSFVGGKYGRT